MTEDPPSRIGPYLVRGEIGRGGMGVVYRGFDPRLKRPVALKALSEEASQDPEVLERFRCEAEILAALDHPHIAPIFGLEEAGGRHYLVLPLVEGPDLAERLKSGPLPVEEAVRVAVQVASALEAAHSLGVVHRDLKPANVKVSAGGTAKLLDFGIAHREPGASPDTQVTVSTTPTRIGEVLGTPGYLSPEQARGQAVDRRTDVWSFGCLLFECLTGKQAFEAPTPLESLAAVLHVEPDWTALPAATPPAVRDLLERCLTKDPEERLDDMAEVRGRLETCLQSGRTPYPPLPARPRHNLPGHLSSFIGRETILAEVRDLLGRERLLTLTGVGGCGKTRLALRAAEESVGRYPDGVWLVELAPVSDPASLPGTIAAVLGVEERRGRPLEDLLLDHLERTRLLLILDNCEHLLDASARWTERILSRAAGVRVLATSREGLGIGGERTYPVPSLTLPRDGEAGDAESLFATESVRLFLERARTARPEVEAMEAEISAVAEICRRLDGMPLAIELAAARTRMFPVREISRRLDDAFRLLTGGSRTALPRQQTLEATLAWSHDLLGEAERVLFRRLAVFRGGWTLGAAERVASGDGLHEKDVLELLAHLLDKSLVGVERREGEARYRYLETMRQYALARLVESGEALAVRLRHLLYFVDLAERAEPHISGPDPEAWLRRLDDEEENVRAALDAAEGGGAEEEARLAALRLAVAARPHWRARGQWRDGAARLDRAISQAGTAIPDRLRARALEARGSLSKSLGDFEEADSNFEAALSLYRGLGEESRVADVLIHLGIISEVRGEYAAARARFEQSLALHREGDRGEGRASVLNCLGILATHEGNVEESVRLQEESLRLYREAGNEMGSGVVLGNLGFLAMERGDLDRAREMIEASLAVYRKLGVTRGVSYSLNNLGEIALARGDLDEAGRLLRESVRIKRKIGDRWALTESLQELAHLALLLSCPRRAARLLGAVDALRRSLGGATPDRPEASARVTAETRSALPEQEFLTAFQEGGAWPLEDSLDYALAHPEPEDA